MNEPKGGVEQRRREVALRCRYNGRHREEEKEPRSWTKQSEAERRDRGQTEKSWLLFEGIDMFLYNPMRKSKIASLLLRGNDRSISPHQNPYPDRSEFIWKHCLAECRSRKPLPDVLDRPQDRTHIYVSETRARSRQHLRDLVQEGA